MNTVCQHCKGLNVSTETPQECAVKWKSQMTGIEFSTRTVMDNHCPGKNLVSKVILCFVIAHARVIFCLNISKMITHKYCGKKLPACRQKK